MKAWKIYPFSRIFSRFDAFSLSYYIGAQLKVRNCNEAEGKGDDLDLENVRRAHHLRERGTVTPNFILFQANKHHC